jgi:hypothetical protein
MIIFFKKNQGIKMKKNVTEQKKITTLKSLTRHGETLH